MCFLPAPMKSCQDNRLGKRIRPGLDLTWFERRPPANLCWILNEKWLPSRTSFHSCAGQELLLPSFAAWTGRVWNMSQKGGNWGRGWASSNFACAAMSPNRAPARNSFYRTAVEHVPSISLQNRRALAIAVGIRRNLWACGSVGFMVLPSRSSLDQHSCAKTHTGLCVVEICCCQWSTATFHNFIVLIAFHLDAVQPCVAGGNSPRLDPALTRSMWRL